MPSTYQLTYAGVPFVLDSAQAFRIDHKGHHESEAKGEHAPMKHQPLVNFLDELNRIVPLDLINDQAYPDHMPPTLRSLARKSEMPPRPSGSLRLNEWYYPVGMSRWGVFYGLATSSMVKAMWEAVNASAGAGPSAQTFVMKANPSSTLPDAGYTVSTRMHLLSTRPLMEDAGLADGLYLVTLVDDRFYHRDTSVTLHVKPGTTWANLITQIALALNVTVTHGGFDAVYQTPELDSQLWCNGESAALLLDAVAANVGCAVVRNLDGTYTLQTPDAARLVARANRLLSQNVRLAGGELFASGSLLPAGDLRGARQTVVPSQVKVTFPLYVQGDDPVPHFLDPRTENQRRSCWFQDSYGAVHTVSVPVQSGGPLVSGLLGNSTQTVHDTAKALVSLESELSGTPVNASGLTALAMRVAQDQYAFRVAGEYDETYDGTLRVSPEGLHDVVWTYSANRRQASCRVIRASWTQTCDDFQHATPAVAGKTSVPKGVGGPQIAQTIRDSHTPVVSGVLAATLQSGSFTATLARADYFPTQNRWRGQVGDEVILFEGTSGGTSVGIVYRGIDGTVQTEHDNGSTVTQVIPNTTYGVNLQTYEKSQFVYPHQWTSGGIQGVNVVPQSQTVKVYDGRGVIMNDALHHSGVVNVYDPTRKGPERWQAREFVWIVDRNAGSIAGSGLLYSGILSGGDLSVASIYSGMYFSGHVLSGQAKTGVFSGAAYDGTLVGYSPSIPGGASAAPVYAVSEQGGPAGDCAWVAGLEATTTPHCETADTYGGSCVLATSYWAAGRCACVPLNQRILMHYDGDEGLWVGDDNFVVCGADELTLLFDPDGCAAPCLKLRDGGSDGGTEYPLTLIRCGDGFAEFAGPGPGSLTALCTGTLAAECGDNTFRVRVECVPCPNPLYSIPGYYCVGSCTDSGGADPGCGPADGKECIYLSSDPGPTVKICSGPYTTNELCSAACGTFDWYCVASSGDCATGTLTCVGVAVGSGSPVGYTVCSGPYPSQADCQAVCTQTPVTPLPCLGINFRTTGITVTVSNKTGVASCLPDTLSPAGQDVDESQFGLTTCPGNETFRLTCAADGTYSFDVVDAPDPFVVVTLLSATASPFTLVYHVEFNAGGGIGGDGTAVFTITSP